MYLTRLLRIVIPIHARAIAGAWLLAFVFCLRDLDLGVLFYPPGSETLPIRIFTLEANGPEAVVAALACVQVAITGTAVALGFALFAWKRGP
jgi:iron(III) transport system permease protein